MKYELNIILFFNIMLTCFFSYACLHINGLYYNLRSPKKSKADVFSVYLPYDSEDSDEDDENPKTCLGLGDFIVFNLMILFIIYSAWSMITKTFVAFGCIISIQIGDHVTGLIGQMWHVRVMPGLPCSVISFSLYTIIVDFIMNYRTVDCSDI
jgi:hypothetical protein